MVDLNRTWNGWLAAVSAVCFAACSGSIGPDEPTPAGPERPAVAEGGSGAASGATGPAARAGSPSAVPSDPGVVTLRRLNRAEYNHTVRDLLRTTLSPADEFPDDGEEEGFDRLGDALSLSDESVAAYAQAARVLVHDLFAADAARKARIVTCSVTSGGTACARAILKAFVRRAWRRPVADAELEPLLGPFAVAQQVGASPEDGLRAALEAALLAPQFLFHLELDPRPGDPTPRRLNDHELASRLSYALWSTMPDDALSAAADAGALQSDAGLRATLDRMLGDPRALRLRERFAGRWLNLQALDEHGVNKTVFPRYTPALVVSMKAEVHRFFEHVLVENRPVSELLSARYSFVDPLLAAHYGLPSPGSPAGQPKLVDLTPVPRMGLVTMAAILTWTSHVDGTSPVRRGQFVLDTLLCSPVPPPPPEAQAEIERKMMEAPAAGPVTWRAQLEEHRRNPACLGCHRLIDPIGLGLEHYDAIGQYRTTDRKLPIDASGELPDGVRFSNALELASLLSRDVRFVDCLTRKLATFLIGRRLGQAADEAWVDHLSQAARGGAGTVKDLVRAVVMSEAFRSRRGRGAAAAP